MSLGGILCLPNLRHKKRMCKITFLVSNSTDSWQLSLKTRNFLFFWRGFGRFNRTFDSYYAYKRENKVVDKKKKRENLIEQQIELIQWTYKKISTFIWWIQIRYTTLIFYSSIEEFSCYLIYLLTLFLCDKIF